MARQIIMDFELGHFHRMRNFGEALYHTLQENGSKPDFCFWHELTVRYGRRLRPVPGEEQTLRGQSKDGRS